MAGEEVDHRTQMNEKANAAHIRLLADDTSEQFYRLAGRIERIDRTVLLR